MGFAQEAVEAVDGDWLQAEKSNLLVEKLRDRRQQAVPRPGVAAQSKVVWKIVGLQQVILYRIVMLADGCAAAWNGRNPLASVLAARAIMEVAALVYDFTAQLKRLCASADYSAIDALVMNRTFGTRNETWQQTQAGVAAVNVLGLLDKMSKLLPGARHHYNVLSEFCHPNSLGQYFLFSDLDMENETLALSDTACFRADIFNHIFCGYMLVGLVDDWLTHIDQLLPTVLELAVADAAGKRAE
jgi:hypothetical protein